MTEGDLVIAEKVINDKLERDIWENYFSKIYPWTTENLSGYMPNYDYTESDVLTTGSSGDQILNLISCGAKNIRCLDINPFVQYYFNLKKALILTLSKEDFVKSFSNNNGSIRMNQKMFDSSKDKLDKYTYSFWNRLFNKYGFDRVVQGLFINNFSNKPVDITEYNCYLQGENYEKLKNRLNDVSIYFDNRNLNEIVHDRQEYDYMFLSNILDYIYNLKSLDDNELRRLEPVYRNFINLLSRLLKDNGKMFFHYFYDIANNYHYDTISDWFKRSPFVSQVEFNGVSKTDGELVYSKKKGIL